jgi:hypothetical protein
LIQQLRRSFYVQPNNGLAALATTTAATSTTTAAAIGICRCSHTNLDAVCFVRNIIHAALDVLVNLFCCFDECLLYVSSSLGRRFKEDKAVLLGELLAFFGADSTPGKQNGSVFG